MKTSELTGAALDWAVAKCMGQENCWMHDYKLGYPVSISTDWSQAGPLIEREGISICYDVELCNTEGSEYWATIYSVGSGYGQVFGPTPLIAAMRCYVASKLGDDVDVPDTFI